MKNEIMNQNLLLVLQWGELELVQMLLDEYDLLIAQKALVKTRKRSLKKIKGRLFDEVRNKLINAVGNSTDLSTVLIEGLEKMKFRVSIYNGKIHLDETELFLTIPHGESGLEYERLLNSYWSNLELGKVAEVKWQYQIPGEQKNRQKYKIYFH